MQFQSIIWKMWYKPPNPCPCFGLSCLMFWLVVAGLELKFEYDSRLKADLIKFIKLNSTFLNFYYHFEIPHLSWVALSCAESRWVTLSCAIALSRAELRCVALCCAVLRCVVLCCAESCWVELSRTELSWALGCVNVPKVLESFLPGPNPIHWT